MHTPSPTYCLQGLDQNQLRERASAYSSGNFAQKLRQLWTNESDVIVALIEEYWSSLNESSQATSSLQETIDRNVSVYSDPIDEAWVMKFAKVGTRMFNKHLSIPEMVVKRADLTSEFCRRLFAKYPDFENVEFAIDTFQRLMMYDLEATIAELASLEPKVARAETITRNERFEQTVVETVESTTAESAVLRERATDAARAMHGIRGKTSEVATAAEQSAGPMREAAHTASGLIRAIDDARTEVEVAAEIATRAAAQASDAVETSRTLSSHAVAIESILGLIREIAGQTKLLALNATIEAARAGDAGRGFTVVAQEVKGLALETAKATEEIAAKITAIQHATNRTVEASDSIRHTIEEVQMSAERIREAMQLQAQTVTVITASVDETALTADSMSSTLSIIRADTERVAEVIDHVDQRFSEVDQRLADLRAKAGAFVRAAA